MNRLCVLALLIGCDGASEPPPEVAVAPPIAAPRVAAQPTPAPALPPEPANDTVVIDLSNDVIIVQATCGDRDRHEDDDEPDDPPLPPCAPQLHDATVAVAQVYPGEDEHDGDVILDVQDRCPDQPEDIDGFSDVDGCPDPEPQPPVE